MGNADGRYRTDGTGARRRQSAVAQRDGQGDHALRAGGLILRALVLATYEQLGTNPGLPASAFPSTTAIYCDVYCYAGIEGFKNTYIPKVLVAQDAGMHDGRIWKPRPTTADLSQRPLDTGLLDPQDADGDHVLIFFLEDNIGLPIITQRISHPRMGQGNEDLVEVGHRMKVNDTDGNFDFWKRNGSFFGVDANGNMIIDLTRAHNGVFGADGSEKPADAPGHGSLTIAINNKSSFSIVGVDSAGILQKFTMNLLDGQFRVSLDGGPTLLVSGKDTQATSTLGAGDVSTAIAEHLEVLWDSFVVQHDGVVAALATFIAAAGAADPPLLAAATAFASALSLISGGTAPEWDPAIVSDKSKIPDNG